jgi:hypothetical protein
MKFIVQNGNIDKKVMSKTEQPINISHIINFYLHDALNSYFLGYIYLNWKLTS